MENIYSYVVLLTIPPAIISRLNMKVTALMIICARPQTEFLKHEFFTGHPFRADWYKTKKMAFTSAIDFFVLFPLASELSTNLIIRNWPLLTILTSFHSVS